MSLSLISESYFLESDSETGGDEDAKEEKNEFGGEKQVHVPVFEIEYGRRERNNFPIEEKSDGKHNSKELSPSATGAPSTSTEQEQYEEVEPELRNSSSRTTESDSEIRDSESTEIESNDEGTNWSLWKRPVSGHTGERLTTPKIQGKKKVGVKSCTRFKCHQCGFNFKDPWKLGKHMKLHSDIGRPWKCQKCGCAFASIKQLQRHERFRHRSVEDEPPAAKYSNSGHLPMTPSDKNAQHREVDKLLKCSKCNIFYLTLEGLRLHENRVHGRKKGGNKYPCRVCGKLFIGRFLVQHMRVHEETDRPWKCAVCPSFYNKSSHLRVHENEFHNRQPGTTKPTCKICGRNFFCPSDLERHTFKFHTDGPGKTWRCKLCQTFFISYGGLSRHHDRIHNRNAGSITCPTCKKPFGRKSLTIRHMRAVHGYGHKAAAMKLLEWLSTQSKSLNATSWQGALKKLRPCQVVLSRCDVLNAPTSNDTSQTHSGGVNSGRKPVVSTRHRRSKSQIANLDGDSVKSLDKIGSVDEASTESKTLANSAKMIFNCPYCIRSFAEAGMLIEHLPIHKNGRKSGVVSSAQMKSQEKDYRNLLTDDGPPNQANNSANQYCCKQCNFSSIAEHSLQLHMKLHSEVGRSFRCKICSCRFPTFTSLRNHEGLRHKGAKHLHHATPLHKCNSCNYSTKSLSNLMFHIEQHKEEGRPFKCSRCGCRFKTLQYLRTHEGRLHNGSNSSDVASGKFRKCLK